MLPSAETSYGVRLETGGRYPRLGRLFGLERLSKTGWLPPLRAGFMPSTVMNVTRGWRPLPMLGRLFGRASRERQVGCRSLRAGLMPSADAFEWAGRPLPQVGQAEWP